MTKHRCRIATGVRVDERNEPNARRALLFSRWMRARTERKANGREQTEGSGLVQQFVGFEIPSSEQDIVAFGERVERLDLGVDIRRIV